ncbi:hypothetical protein [Heyndrickxia oleronia]|nr:hypothetical protein [Heyndrickxia oleronia]
METGKYLRNALLGKNITEIHEMNNITIRIRLGTISSPPFLDILYYL